MAALLKGPIQQQLFDCLAPQRGRLPKNLIWTIANNLAFLIKYTSGAKVRAEQISVTIIDVRGPNNSEVGHKATVCLRDGPGKFTVVVWKQVKWEENVIIGLTEKVDKVVKDILAKEGNKGYGDFKV